MDILKDEWKGQQYFLRKYAMEAASLRAARANGLPFKKYGRLYFYREKDINNYYAGKIGNDVKRRQKI